MRDGVCYQISNSTTLYVYPNLTCTDGQAIPATSSTTRETWIFNEKTKDFYKSSTSNNVSVNYNTSNPVTGHIWHTPSWSELVEPSAYLLPATIVVLCLANVILKMFMGVRR